MAKKKTNATGLAILADFRNRVDAGESIAAAHAAMKRELRGGSSDPDAALETLLEISRKAHAGTEWADIETYIASREPAAEPPIA